MTMKRSRLAYVGVVFCIAVFVCTGCQSRQLIVHGNSGIISYDAQLQLGRLAADSATEQEVQAILGRPLDTVLSDDGSRTLHYGCVVTVLKTYYLFSPKVTEATWQETGLHRCRICVGPDGMVRDIDYRFGISDNTMHPMSLPRRD